MGDNSRAWANGDSWQTGCDPWSQGKARISKFTRQLFFFDQSRFKGHDGDQAWLMEVPPASAISSANATMTKEEHDFKAGNIPWNHA